MTSRRMRPLTRIWLLSAIVILMASVLAIGCGAPPLVQSISGQKPTTASQAPLDETMVVHFVDVGQADCILVQVGAKAMLVDAGNNADANTVVDYIKAQGISNLEWVIGTHPHEDHVGGLDAVIQAFGVRQVIMPKATTTTKTFEDVLQALKEKGLTISSPVPGSTLSLGSATCTILAPNSNGYDDMNDYSVVLKISYGNISFLLTGDAGHVSENEIVDKGFDVSADVIKIGHHGSSSATSEAFLDRVAPQYAVIQVGQGNDYGHPSAETMDLLKERGIPVYRTDECGTVVATTDGKTVSLSTAPGTYWTGGK